MSLDRGTKLGPYKILEPLGAGGMGEVYRARDPRLGRDVALKILPDEVADDAARRQRFELEARAVAALNHPNIVAVYDIGNEGRVAYMITEFVDGKPLRGKFPLRKALDIGVQIADALAVAHAAGVAHRDLKPDNILLTPDGRVKVLDFGLAKITAPRLAAADAETLTWRSEAGVVMGTIGYMSPEQARGQASDHRSDIFSLGVILYELLAARRPFDAVTRAETIAATLKEDPPDLPEAVPSGLRQIVGHCLEKEPANRFQSALDLCFALRALAQNESHGPMVPPPGRASQWSRRALAVLAALILVVLSVFADRMFRRTSTNSWSGVLLGGPEIAMGPRISPDGRTLAFQAMVAQVTQVAMIRPESGNWTVLTHKRGGGYVTEISWSPDGNKLYFDRMADVPKGIFSVPVLGGEEQLILEDAYYPEALPDGSLLGVRLNAGRQYQVFHFWPETGRFQWLPVEIGSLSNSYPALRAFPDGQEAVVVGKWIGSGKQAVHLYIVELRSGRVRRLTTGFREETSIRVGVTRDGKSVLAASNSGDLFEIVSIPRKGRSPARSLLTLTEPVTYFDSGPEGNLYVDQLDQPLNVLRFSTAGGYAQKVGAIRARGQQLALLPQLAVLSDGRAIAPDAFGGRARLVVVEVGKDPVPLVNTPEETAPPVTVAGPLHIAFLIGPEPRHTIAMAAISNGRITSRIHFDKGTITSLACSPDGKTLFCAAGGAVWSIPVSGRGPRKICPGDSVAVDPAGQNLLVQVVTRPKPRLIRVPLDGGPEQELPLNGPFHLAWAPIASNSISRDGRILVPLALPDSWFFAPGIIDLQTGRMTRIPVDHFGDYHHMAWTSDGQVIAAARDLRAAIWKFQPRGR
jgi:serine/threonine protein kinase